MNRLSHLWIVLLLLSAAAAQGVSRVALLPQKALLKVHVNHAHNVVNAVKTSPMGRLWQDPAMKPCLGDFSLQDELFKLVHKDIGHEGKGEMSKLMIEEIKMTRREVCVGINFEGDFYFSGWISPEDYKRSIAMDKRLAALEGETKRIARSRFQGIDLYRFITLDDEGEALRSHWSTAVGNTLVAGTDEEWVRRSVAKLKREQVEEPPDDASVKVTFDFQLWMSKMMGSAAMQSDARAQMDAAMQALGLNRVGALTVKLECLPDLMKVEASLPVGRSMNGLFSIFDVAPTSTGFKVPFVSGETVGYSVGKLNLLALWQAVPGILNGVAATPEQQAAAAGVLGQLPTMLGIDLENDLLVHLGQHYVSTSAYREGGALADLFALELRNEQAVQATLAKMMGEQSPLYAALQDVMEKNQFRGVDIYETSQQMGGNGTAISAAGGYLLVGDATMVRAALQGMNSDQSDQFYQRKEYAWLRARTPANAIGFSLTDLRRVVKGGNDVFASLRELDDLGSMTLSRSSRQKTWMDKMDLDQLPDSAFLAKFFGPLIGVSLIEDGVLHSKVDVLYPEVR